MRIYKQFAIKGTEFGRQITPTVLRYKDDNRVKIGSRLVATIPLLYGRTSPVFNLVMALVLVIHSVLPYKEIAKIRVVFKRDYPYILSPLYLGA